MQGARGETRGVEAEAPAEAEARLDSLERYTVFKTKEYFPCQTIDSFHEIIRISKGAFVAFLTWP